MRRFPSFAIATVLAAASIWAASASAQNSAQNRSFSRDGGSAWGDPWMNENDFDYNRQHWLPRNGAGRNRSVDRSNHYYGNRNK